MFFIKANNVHHRRFQAPNIGHGEIDMVKGGSMLTLNPNFQNVNFYYCYCIPSHGFQHRGGLTLF
jgi:hypothetical protein